MIKSTQIDPVTVQVLRNKVSSLVDEMHYHFYRSGYSTIIRESKLLFDPSISKFLSFSQNIQYCSSNVFYWRQIREER